MNIVVLNWRDIKHPHAGGAEQLTHEIAKRWVKWGHTVTWLSAGFKESPRTEVIDDIQVIRFGRWWSVHLFAAIYYIKNLARFTDIVVDEVHWFPFFARLYEPDKTVLLACEVANQRFFTIFPVIIAAFFRFVERMYLKLYKNTPTLAISYSTREELVEEGLLAHNITVLTMGINKPAYLTSVRLLPKESEPTYIFLGRINKLKGAEDMFLAFAETQLHIPDAQLWYVGNSKSSYASWLKRKIEEKGLSSIVSFFGHVDNQKKFELLRRAHVLVVPSVHEGWGLVVSEAGLVGTPSVVYDVPGLREVANHVKTGLIVQPYPDNLAQGMIDIVSDRKIYTLLQNNARQEAEGRDWNMTAREALMIFEKIYEKNNRHHTI